MNNSTPPSERPACPLWAKIIATGGGVGYIPFAPGTWGSLAAVILFVLGGPFYFALALPSDGSPCVPILLPECFALPLLFILIGIPAATKFACATGVKDPHSVVIDEFAGQTLTLCGYLFDDFLSPSRLLIAFLLFRLLDIWKPWPIRWFERLPGGWGIMMDDVVAGVFGAIILAVLVHFRWLPGM